MRSPRAVFWAATATLGWVYAGYPLTAWLVGRLRPFRVRREVPGPGLVSVGIPARDEAERLPGRIADILAQTVPFEIEVLVASDGSTDATEAVVEELARDDPRIRLLPLAPGGTAVAQNAIFEQARGAIVVLTDAETRYAPGCLDALVAPFSDPRVGCTTGRLGWFRDTSGTARHEGLYWRYEVAVRDAESRAGWLTTITGALAAVRRDLYRTSPPYASVDQLLPLLVRDADRIVLSVPDARGEDRGWGDLRDQFRSRTRIATRGIQTCLRMAPRLTPWRRPSAFLAVWSHKLLRWATPWLGLAALGSAARLVAHGERRYAAPLTAGIGVLGLGAAGLAARARGRSLRLTSFPVTLCVVNAAFGLAWVNLLRRRRIPSWRHHGAARDRGLPAARPHPLVSPGPDA